MDINLHYNIKITYNENIEYQISNKAKSFVFGFIQSLNAGGKNGTNNIKHTLSDGVTTQPISSLMRLDAPADNSDWGIVVGMGTTTVTNTDFKLENQITHGVAANQLSHGAMVLEDVVDTGTLLNFSFRRDFKNNTNANVVVNECGTYCLSTSGAFDPNSVFMIIRDIITPPITITPGRTLTVEYIERTVL